MCHRIFQILILLGLSLATQVNIFAQNDSAQADSLGLRLLEQVELQLSEKKLPEANELAWQAIQFFLKQKDWQGFANASEALYQNDRITNGGFEQRQSIIDLLLRSDSFLTTLPADTALQAKAKVLSRTGLMYHLRGQYPEAVTFYERAMLPTEKIDDQYTLLRLYTNAASMVWALGDDQRALNYRKKALSMSYEQQDTGALVHNLTEAGSNWNTMDTRQAIPYFKKSLELAPKRSLTYILYSKAHLDKATKDYSKALELAKKGLEYAYWDDEKSDALHQLGRVNYSLKKYDQALANYQQALVFGKEGYGAHHPEYVKIFKYIADTHLAKKDFQTALEYYNQCLEKLLPLFAPTNPEQNPEINQLTNFSLWILEALQGKSVAYKEQFEQTKNIEDKLKALKTAELAINYLQRLEQSYGQDESKYQIRNSYYDISETAITIAFELAEQTKEDQYLKKAFEISENNKAIVLSEVLYRKEIKKIAGIPDSLFALEKALHEDISYWRKEISSNNETQLSNQQDSLFKAHRQLEIFEQALEKDFPEYANAKFSNFSPQKITNIQKTLSDNSLLIEYFLADSSICFFVIGKNNFKAFRSKKAPGFDQQLNRFLQTINDWKFVQDSSSLASTDFLQSSHFLYENLLGDFLGEYNPQHLIIIPDGQLALVPFEVLLTEAYQGKWTDRDVPYLIKQLPISYQFSTKFIDQSGRQVSSEWGGFGAEYDNTIQDAAASYSLRDGGKLPYADDEVRTIANFTGGTPWLNEDATRANFLNYAKEYGILHLATHGILDQKNPLQSHLLFAKSIAGEDAAVYAHEIYGLQLNAGLTVLSACNTGSGVWKRGEGIMSLARAFSFAGCPSVVMSMWSVSDQSTARIMTGFYKNLQAGKTKDTALQQAKLNYLQTASTEYTKPIYWASFVAIGDVSALPMVAKEKWPWWNIAGVIILIGLTFFFFLSRKKK